MTSANEKDQRSAFARFFDVGWYIFPILLVGAAHLIPPLAQPVVIWVEGTPQLNLPPELMPVLPWWLLLQTVVAVAWIILDFRQVAALGQPIRLLRANMAASIAVALILAVASTWQLFAADHKLPWGYLVPLIASILDAFMTGDQAINNAAQRPYHQQLDPKA